MERIMRQRIRNLSVLALLGASLGCSICASPFDQDYIAYGSRTPRQDMRHGRVGSPFSDPALNGSVSEGVEVLDESYAEILEDADSGPIFMDEPSSEPIILESLP
jgi:hypothetical protein